MGLGSGIRDPEKNYSGSQIPDPGVKKAPDPGSATLEKKTCDSGSRRMSHHEIVSRTRIPPVLYTCDGIPGNAVSSLCDKIVLRTCFVSHVKVILCV